MDARGGQDEDKDDQGKKGNQDKEGNDDKDNADNAKYGGGVSSIGELVLFHLESGYSGQNFWTFRNMWGTVTYSPSPAFGLEVQVQVLLQKKQ